MIITSKSGLKQRIKEIEKEIASSSFRSFEDGTFCFELERVDTDETKESLEYIKESRDIEEFYRYKKDYEIINGCKLIDVPDKSESIITYGKKNKETSVIKLFADNEEKTKREFIVKTPETRDDETFLLYNFTEGLSQNFTKDIGLTFVIYYDLEDYELMKKEIYEYENHDNILDAEERLKYARDPEYIERMYNLRKKMLKADKIKSKKRNKKKKK